MGCGDRMRAGSNLPHCGTVSATYLLASRCPNKGIQKKVTGEVMLRLRKLRLRLRLLRFKILMSSRRPIPQT
jgi:hypothetical protein